MEGNGPGSGDPVAMKTLDPDVYRSGGTGQCVCKTGLSETGDGSYQLPWREDGTGKLQGGKY